MITLTTMLRWPPPGPRPELTGAGACLRLYSGSLMSANSCLRRWRFRSFGDKWEDKDTFCVPGWTEHEHANLSNSEPAFLFSFTDIPVMQSLDLLREEGTEG